MFSWLGKLFGSDKAAEALIGNVSNGIDKLWYTEEEKAEDIREARIEGNKVYMRWLESTSGSRVARRFIAVVVTVIWAAQYAGSLLMACIAPWVSDPEVMKAVMETSRVLQENGQQGDAAFMVILAFYFAFGSSGDNLRAKAIEKFTNKSGKNKETNNGE